MKKGILGRKEGMTQVFTKDGVLVPVTVISVEPNVVMQIKNKETDGYEAIQLGFGSKRESLSNKAQKGHAKKANATPKRFLKEIKGVDVANYQIGQEIKADLFEAGEVIDITGVSKGKGFSGVIKRYNQTRGPMSHGSQYHRGVGSLGQRRPMHVLKGKKLPGHMGFETVTIQNLEIVETDVENNIILVKGNVPGPKKSLVIIRTSVKYPDSKREVLDLINYNNEELLEETEIIEENQVIDEVVEDTTQNNAEVIEESSPETEK
jgi:large subunit ribosomal protein L3